MATQPGWATDEPEETLRVSTPKAGKASSTYQRSAPQAGAPDWAGKFAPRVGRHQLCTDIYARPTVAQVRYYRMLGGAGNVDGMYRGELSNAISALKDGGAVSKPQVARQANKAAASKRSADKRASVNRFFLGGKKGFRS